MSGADDAAENAPQAEAPEADAPQADAPEAAPAVSQTTAKRTRRIKQDGPGKGTKYLDEEDVNPQTRIPTDCPCCCLFIAAIIVWGIMHKQCYDKENPFKITHPLDHAGNACGLGDYADYPKVYYPAKKMIHGGPLISDVYYSNPQNLHGVCTKECPTGFTRQNRPAMCRDEPVAQVAGDNENATQDVAGVIQNMTGGNFTMDKQTAASVPTLPSFGSSLSQLVTVQLHVHGSFQYSNQSEAGLNQTGSEAPASETAASEAPATIKTLCTWYSETPANLFLGQYCIMGNSFMTGSPNEAGTVCQSAQKAVQDVQDEAFQSLDNMENATEHYLKYINETIPEVKTDPEMRQVMIRMETDNVKRVVTYKDAVKNAGSNSSEKNLVQVCRDAVGSQRSFLTDFWADVVNSQDVLITCAFVGLFTGACYLILICFFVKPVVWGSCFVCIVGFGIAGWLFWDEAVQVGDTGLTGGAVSEEKILAVICWIACLVCIIIVTACRRSLELAVGISSATASFLMKNVGIMLLPQLISLLQIGFLVYWVIGLSGILSTAEINPAEDVTKEHNRYVIDDIMRLKIIYHCFIGFWVHGFFEGLVTVSTALTVTDWYYMPKVNGKKPTCHFSFIRGFGQALFYHCGSVAFGSLIIAIVQTLRVVLEFYTKTVKRLAGETTAKILMGCCRCILQLTEKLLKFINFNGYILIGISGKMYLKSCKEAWGVITRNPMRFVVFHGVMWTLNFIGRLVIVGVTLLWGALLMNKSLFPGLSKAVHSPWPILLVIIIIGWMLAGLVIGLFTTAGAALFYNFVCDEEVCTFSGGDYKNHAPGELGKLLEREAARQKSGNHQDDEKAPLADEDEEAGSNEQKDTADTAAF